MVYWFLVAGVCYKFLIMFLVMDYWKLGCCFCCFGLFLVLWFECWFTVCRFDGVEMVWDLEICGFGFCWCFSRFCELEIWQFLWVGDFTFFVSFLALKCLTGLVWWFEALRFWFLLLVLTVWLDDISCCWFETLWFFCFGFGYILVMDFLTGFVFVGYLCISLNGFLRVWLCYSFWLFLFCFGFARGEQVIDAQDFGW